MLTAFASGCAAEAPESFDGIESTASEVNDPDNAGASDERAPHVAAQLSELSDRLSISDPPDVEIVREITADEYVSVMVECMRENGWEVVATPDGGLEFPGIDGAQVASRNLAHYTCVAQYPFGSSQGVQRELAGKALRDLHSFYVGEVTPCLVAEGYDIVDIPSWELFESRYSMGDEWNPYTQVSEQVESQEEWDRLNGVCSQLFVVDDS